MSVFTSIRVRRGLDAVANQFLHALIVGLVLLSVALVAVPVAERYSPSHERALLIAIPLVLVFELSSGVVRRFVDWLLYGSRGDAATASWQMARGLEQFDDDKAVTGLTSALVDTLRLSHLQVVTEVDGTGTTIAEHGTDGVGTTRFPITHAGVEMGQLSVRRRYSALDVRDERLLQAAAAQLGVVLHASRLAAQLQHAREELVLSREDERKRLRRELHDGVGPALAGIGLGLEAAENALPANISRSQKLLSEVRTDVAGLIEDVRRVVDGLRPPLLDEVGLVGALTQRANAFARTSGWTVRLDSDPLPALPAAVEVAAFRIGSEALTNVARHAHATRCDIRLGIRDGSFEMEIRDDGSGGATPGKGTGLASIRDRATELGGIVTIDSHQTGTTLRVRIPLTGMSSHD
jgi:signal transduction histidine kinase